MNLSLQAAMIGTDSMKTPKMHRGGHFVIVIHRNTKPTWQERKQSMVTMTTGIKRLEYVFMNLNQTKGAVCRTEEYFSCAMWIHY